MDVAISIASRWAIQEYTKEQLPDFYLEEGQKVLERSLQWDVPQDEQRPWHGEILFMRRYFNRQSSKVTLTWTLGLYREGAKGPQSKIVTRDQHWSTRKHSWVIGG